MSFIKDVLRDLVEKRLWPLALGLVILLAAVPALMSGGTQSPVTPATSSAKPATEGVAQDGVVTVAQGAPAQRSRSGKLHDPFVPPEQAQGPPTTASTSGSSASASGSGDTAVTSAGGGVSAITGAGSSPFSSGSTGLPSPGGSGGTSTGSSTPKAPAAPATDDFYRVTLRFGRNGGQLKTVTDLPRLSPLPSIEDPFFVFLGVLDDHKTATFLVSADAEPTGDGVCRPSTEQCDTVELQPGDIEFFDYAPEGQEPVQYQLELVRVRKATATAATAAAANVRRSVAGQELVRTMTVSEGSATLRGYHYRPGDGLLVRAKAKASAKTASVGERKFVFRAGEVPAFRTRPAAK